MSDKLDITGVIFNVQHYCIHDGPGIRTTLFVKGCPLRCLWCQNPESQSMQPLLFFMAEKCAGCGLCAAACPLGAISILEGKAKTDRSLCKGCGSCASVCPQEARSIMGEEVSASEIYKKIAQDKIFYEGSGGGATISGGEPLAQPEFTKAILQKCRENGIHTALETCGYARWEVAEAVFEFVDLILFDLKHMDPLKHEKCTSVSNELILANLKKIYHLLKKQVIVRIPIIPGYNDSPGNIEASAQFISSELGKDVQVHLLPFHRLGESKNERMETENLTFHSAPPSEEHMEGLKKIFEAYGLKAQIGG